MCVAFDYKWHLVHHLLTWLGCFDDDGAMNKHSFSPGPRARGFPPPSPKKPAWFGRFLVLSCMQAKLVTLVKREGGREEKEEDDKNKKEDNVLSCIEGGTLLTKLRAPPPPPPPPPPPSMSYIIYHRIHKLNANHAEGSKMHPSNKGVTSKLATALM